MTEPVSANESSSISVYSQRPVNHHELHPFDPEYDYINDPIAILYADSDNPLINSIIFGNYPTTTENLITVAETVRYVYELGVKSLKEMRLQYNILVVRAVSDLKKYSKAKTDVTAFSIILKYVRSDEKKKELEESIASQTAVRDKLGPDICERAEKSYKLLQMYAVIGKIIGLKVVGDEWNPTPIFCGTRWADRPPELTVEVPFVRQIVWD